MTTSTRKATAPAEPAAPVRAVTVAVNGKIRDYPDVLERFTEFRANGGVLIGKWAADRLASDLLSRAPWMDRVPAWVYLDDFAIAYLVEFTRKPRGRVAKATIVGAARYGTDPAEAPRVEDPDVDPDALLVEPPADGVNDEDRS